MILWCDGAHDAPENMRRDLALWSRAESSRDRFEPVLRLFRFAPARASRSATPSAPRTNWTSRAAARTACAGRCARPAAARSSTTEEWTYSLTAAFDDPDWGGSQRATYERIGAAAARFAGGLGVPVPNWPGRRRRSGAARPARPRRAPCFASTARLELVREGRKLAGSAQRRGRARATCSRAACCSAPRTSGSPTTFGLPGQSRARGTCATRSRRGRRTPATRSPPRRRSSPGPIALESVLGEGVRRAEADTRRAVDRLSATVPILAFRCRAPIDR